MHCSLNALLQFGIFASCHFTRYGPDPEVIYFFSYSTQLSTKSILLINVKMPTVVGILTFVSMMNTTSGRCKTRNFFICRYFSVYERLKCRAELS